MRVERVYRYRWDDRAKRVGKQRRAESVISVDPFVNSHSIPVTIPL